MKRTAYLGAPKSFKIPSGAGAYIRPFTFSEEMVKDMKL